MKQIFSKLRIAVGICLLTALMLLLLPTKVQAATITLLAGSTSANLQTAINGAASGDTIELSSDMTFTAAVTVPSGKTITITSTTGNALTMTHTAAARHFNVTGSLILENITLDGDAVGGGIQVNSAGTLQINAGSTILNCRFANGGIYANGGKLILNGGKITGNTSSSGGGGGVYMANGAGFTMNSGEISGNKTTGNLNGGGVYMTGTSSTFTMTGGSILNNTANAGGGVYVNQGTFTAKNCEISYNAVTGGNGAGVNIPSASGIATFDNVDFTENSASNWGGGIYMYGSALSVTGGTFNGNTAAGTMAMGGGGGIYANPGLSLTVSLQDITFTENKAIGGYGGGANIIYLSTSTQPLTVLNCIFSANQSSKGGGGLLINQCSDATVTNCTMNNNITAGDASSGGGGLLINADSTVKLSDSRFTENNAAYGGGISCYRSTLNLSNMTIDKNIASGDGGGIITSYAATLNIIGDTLIEQNRALNGGGIFAKYLYSGTGCTVNISGSNNVIDTNEASNNGGGIYLGTGNSVSVSGGASISGNIAGGNGGGIYTEEYSYTNPATAAYQNIQTDSSTLFNNNTAAAAYIPPDNAASFTNIGYATTSITNNGSYIHPLNNYDVNYAGPLKIEYFTVTYNPNSGTGGLAIHDIFVGNKHTVLTQAAANVARSGYTFTGWNTDPDGTGAAYAPSDQLTVTGDTILYAQWTKNNGGGTYYTVIYHWNDGRSGDVYLIQSIASGGKAVKPTAPVREDYIFGGWYLDEASTQAYDFDTPVTSNLDLYAKWTQIFSKDHYAYLIGYSDGTIHPKNNITRAEAATVFFRLISDAYREEVWQQSNPFHDVALSSWYNNAVSTMVNAGIITGYPDGSFNPNASITRAEFAAMAARFTGETYTGSNLFPDISGHWAAEYINLAAQLGWIEGYEDGTFKPNAYITRAEVATFINRVTKRRLEDHDDLLPGMLTFNDNMDETQWYYLAIQEATNSHSYNRKVAGDDSSGEIWVSLIENRQWGLLERPGSTPCDIYE